MTVRQPTTWSDGPDADSVLVPTGEIALAERPRVLITPALGSCVGVAVWSRERGRGGLAHVMLPAAAGSRADARGDRFATIAIPKLVAELAEGGGGGSLIAKIAGGSTMFAAESVGPSIGERNVAEVKRQLTLLNVSLLAEDTGGAHARTMEFYVESGLVIVRSYRFGIREL